MNILKKLAKIILELLILVVAAVFTAIVNEFIDYKILLVIIGLLFLLYYIKLEKKDIKNKPRIIKIRLFELFLFIVIWGYLSFSSILAVGFYTYIYESTDHGFITFEMPAKGRDLEGVENAFEEYKKYIGRSDIELRRTFKKDWSRFLRWKDYLTNRRWDYPYMEQTRELE